VAGIKVLGVTGAYPHERGWSGSTPYILILKIIEYEKAMK